MLCAKCCYLSQARLLLALVALAAVTSANNKRYGGGVGLGPYGNVNTLPALIGGRPGGGGGGGYNGGGGGFNGGGGGYNGNNGGVGNYGGGGSDTCRYWCKTDLGAYYCCENGRKQPGIIATKPGSCPPVRATCPRFRPPTTCSNDGSCRGIDKCCFDKCLGEHVCKAPLPIGISY